MNDMSAAMRTKLPRVLPPVLKAQKAKISIGMP